MDKRYQVFVSSTYMDLQDERQAVMQTLLQLDCIPSGMELFPASDEPAWELIKRVIDECDYYVVIIGGRYGSRDPKGVSYTEREYDHAVQQGIPVLGFVHADPSLITVGKSELDAEAQAKLTAFREKVMSRVVAKWRNADELGNQVMRSLVQAMKLDPREGWVRGRFANSPELINKYRLRIDELENELRDMQIRAPVSAEGLAQGATKFTIHYADGPTPRQLSITWDVIIATVGPLMLNESTERDLQRALETKIATTTTGLSYSPHIEIIDDDFHTIKLQLFALGIIQQSDRKRAASDTNTYWTLTPYGRHYTMTLKAIRAG